MAELNNYMSCDCGNKIFYLRHTNWIECTECNKIKVLYEQANHRFNENMALKSIDTPEPEDQSEYICKVCGRPFQDEVSYYEHYDEVHN